MSFFNRNKKDDDISFFKENDTNKRSLFHRLFKNDEGQVYSDIITKGFIWVLMFFVSLVVLILVFKEESTDKKEIVVVNSSNDASNYMNDDDNKKQDSEDFAFNSDNTDSNEDKTAKEPKKNDKPVITKSETKAQQPEKQEPTELKKTRGKPTLKNNSNIGASKDIENIIRSNTDSNPNRSNNVKTAPQVSNKVWLVNVLSSQKLSVAKMKWTQIEEANPNLFIDKKPYFIKSNIENKGIYYRVALGDADTDDSYPAFSSLADANKFCKYLKNNKVNCFSISVEKQVIIDLIDKNK